MICVFFFLCLSSPFRTVKVLWFSSTVSFLIGKWILLILWGVKSKHFPGIFNSTVKNKRKIKENRNIYAKSIFDLILVFGVTQILTKCFYYNFLYTITFTKNVWLILSWLRKFSVSIFFLFFILSKSIKFYMLP